jgi:hypothetical protein
MKRLLWLTVLLISPALAQTPTENIVAQYETVANGGVQ